MSSEEDSSADLLSDQSLKGCKVKRTRQRVDAGEPRNSYASIANFSSRAAYLNHPFHQYNSNGLNLSPPNKLIGDTIPGNERISSKNDMTLDEAVMQMCVNGALNPGQIAPPFLNGGNGLTGSKLKTESNNNIISNANNSNSTELEFNYKSGGYLSTKSSSEATAAGAHLLRDILQTGRKADNSEASDQSNQCRQSHNLSGNSSKGGEGAEAGLSQCSDASDLDEEENQCTDARNEEGMDQKANDDQSSPLKQENQLSLASSRSSRSPSPSAAVHHNRPNASIASAEVKRARVENIVSNMLLGSNGPVHSSGKGSNSDSASNSVNGCKKRKLYQPQQSKLNGPDDEDEEAEYLADEEELVEEDELDLVNQIDLAAKRAKTEDKDNLRRQLEDMQSQLIAMRQRYVQLFEAQQKQRQMCLTGSPVNLTAEVTPEDECDTEMEDLASDKDPNTPVSQLSELTNRDLSATATPTVANTSAGDASHFLDEARRLISEQEKIANKSDRQSCIVRTTGGSGHTASAAIPDMDWLIDSLKGEIQTSVSQIIEKTFAKYVHRRQTAQKLTFEANSTESKANEITILSQMLDRKSPRSKVIDRGAAVTATSATSNAKTNLNGHPGQSSHGSPYSLPTETAPAPRPSPFTFPAPAFKSPFYMPSVAPAGAQMPQQPALIPSALAHHFTSIASSLSQRSDQSNNYSNRDVPHIPGNTNGHPSSQLFGRPEEPLPEQNEALSLVVAPKRKRHKVTDTRITPRTVSRLLGHDSFGGRDTSSVSPPPSLAYPGHGPSQPPPPLVPVSLPTSVAIPNPSLHQTDIFGAANFPFGDHPRLSLFGEDNDLNRDSKSHSAHAVASAVAHAAAAHHLHMLAASRASPDSLHGYSGNVVSSLQYGRGGSDNGNEGSETNETQVYDSTMPMISFSLLIWFAILFTIEWLANNSSIC